LPVVFFFGCPAIDAVGQQSYNSVVGDTKVKKIQRDTIFWYSSHTGFRHYKSKMPPVRHRHCMWHMFVLVTRGGGLPQAGHTQRNQANPTARGPRQSLTREIRLTPLSQAVPSARTKIAWCGTCWLRLPQPSLSPSGCSSDIVGS
jgi:hypothetical protein